MEGRTLITRALLLSFFAAFVSASVSNRKVANFNNERSAYTEAAIPKASPTPECVDTITCRSAKFVAKCVTCRPEYFYCESSGAAPIERNCPDGQVFNPDRAYPQCVLPSNCPYHPPWTAPPTSPLPTSPPPTTAASSTTGAATTGAVTTGAATTGAATTGATTTGGSTTTATTGPSTTTDPAATTTTAGPTTTAAVTTSAPTTGAATTGAATTGAPTTGPTTGAPTSAAPTTVPTVSAECYDSITCEDAGFYARCVTCQKDFFKCDQAGKPGSLMQCSGGQVFNPDPLWPRCILPSNCPYHP